MTDADARAPWREARTLTDLGALMARWLEGDLTYQPAYHGAAPDPETAPLVPTLAGLNRAGFVTEQSQPGETWTGGGQRAFVSGFCDDEAVDRIQKAALGTDVVVLAMPPMSVWQGLPIPVSMGNGEAATWVGWSLDVENLVHHYGQDVHPDGLSSLAVAWQVQAFDPHWGRTELLWQVFRTAFLG